MVGSKSVCCVCVSAKSQRSVWLSPRNHVQHAFLPQAARRPQYSRHTIDAKASNYGGGDEAALYDRASRWLVCSEHGSIRVAAAACTDAAMQDDTVEQRLFNENPSHDYTVEYVQDALWPTGTTNAKPWTAMDKALRDRVDGIMVLKMSFTAEDVALFPNLKV